MTKPPTITHTPYTLARRRHDAARRHEPAGPDESRVGNESPTTDEVVPELIWLADLPDGLEAFAPEPHDGRPSRAPGAAAADAGPAPLVAASAARMAPPRFPDVSRAFRPHPSLRVDWVKQASRAALLCIMVAAAADWFYRYEPVPQPSLPSTTTRVARSGPPAGPPVTQRPQPAPPVASAPVAAQPSPQAAAPPPAPRVETARPPAPQVATRAVPVTAPSRPPIRPTPATTTARVDARPAPPVRVATAPPAPVALPPAAAVTTTAAAGAPAASLPAPAEPSVPSATDSRATTPPAVEPGPAPVSPAPAASETRRARADIDQRAIEAVLSRYRTAFNRLDAGAASAVWPSVNEKTLSRAFERLENQEVSFERCAIETAAVHAEAACSGTARYVPKVGNRTPKAEARQWRFSLHRAGDGWLIDSVDAR